MQGTDLKKLISTPSGVFSATKLYVFICFIGLIIFGIQLWENVDIYFVFSAGDYIYPTLTIICGIVCILTLSVQTKLAREEYSRIYPLASFGSSTRGNLLINLFFVFSSIIPIMTLLLPFSYTDPISLALTVTAFLVYVSLLKITFRNTIALGQLVSVLMVFCLLAQQTLYEISTGGILLYWVVIGTVWVACVAWDLLSKNIYPPTAKMDSFGINDAKFIIRMNEMRNWQSHCPAFNRDDLWDLLDRFDRFVTEGSHFRNNRLIWLVHVFYKPINTQLDFDTYMTYLKKYTKRLDRVYIIFWIFAAMFPPLLMFILPWRTVPN